MLVLLIVIVPAMVLLAVALFYPLKPPKGFESVPTELTDIPEIADAAECQVIPFPAGHEKVLRLTSPSQPEGVLLPLSELRNASMK